MEELFNPALPDSIGNLGTTYRGVEVLQLFIQNFINIAFGVGGLVFFAMILWGGYEYMTAGGDKEAVQKATKRMTNGFIGIVILFCIFAIIAVVELLFGINLRNITIPFVTPTELP